MVYKYAIIDSGVLIKGEGMNFHKLAENLVTIREVFNEIRDKKARNVLDTLPYELVELAPSAESLSFVIQFAKKTGDFSSLSITDLKLIALAHTLELKANGGINLRTEPVKSVDKNKMKPNCIIQAEPISTPNYDKKDIALEANADIRTDKSESLDGSFTENIDGKKFVRNGSVDVSDEDLDGSYLNNNDAQPRVSLETIDQGTGNLSDEIEILNCDIVPNLTAESDGENFIPGPKLTEQYVSKIIGRGTAQHDEKLRLADDGQNWVSAANLHQNLDFGNCKYEPPNPDIEVASFTTDFAMQNVLLQIGLHVASTSGQLIKSVKSWILRCNGCYKVHYDMQRLFCSECGLNYLSKIGCHTDSNTGKLILHLKKNFHHSTRGMKYSLPSPEGALRFEGDLLLREDQLLTGIWRQKSHTIRKNVASAFGDEITGDVGINISKGLRIAVGYGRKNPNAIKGRERRGKKKS